MRKRAFKDLAEYRAERDVLKARVLAHENALAQRRNWMKDPAFRNELLGNTAIGMVKGFRPLETLGSAFSTSSGPISAVVAGLLGSRARTIKGKLLSWGLAMALPPIVKMVGRSEFFKNALDKVLSLTKEDPEMDQDLENEQDPAVERSA